MLSGHHSGHTGGAGAAASVGEPRAPHQDAALGLGKGQHFAHPLHLCQHQLVVCFGFFFLLRCFRKHLKDWRSWAEGWDRVMLQPVLGFGLLLGWVVPRERSGPLCAHPCASSLAAGYLEQKRDAELLGMAWTPWHMQWVEVQGERGHHGTLVEGWCESPWLSVTSPLVRNV